MARNADAGNLVYSTTTPVHTLLMAHRWKHVLQSFRWEVLAHPLHSPDLTPSDFHLFPKLKEHLGGKAFIDDNKVQDTVTMWLTVHVEESSMTSE